ncbi:hypothetical protein [Amycolatopsis sp. RTGN1]|uniref:hypothetical protein n=1 Tax=Amycolatopsis ponsaeliensis TaxID=2992142 RepID=UPI00254A8224|nr:hypothetical protein [Amycolatopsis sp. RTGN1]
MIGPAPASSIWIPPKLAHRIRRVGTVSGAVTLAAAALVGVGMPVIGPSLPTATSPVTMLTTSAGIFLGLFLAVSGVTMTMARGWVSLGRHHTGTDFIFDARPAATGSVVLLSAAAASILSALFFYTSYTANITWSSGPHAANVHPVTPSIALFLLLPALAVGLTLANLVVGLPLFRPSQRTIQRYTR